MNSCPRGSGSAGVAAPLPLPLVLTHTRKGKVGQQVPALPSGHCDSSEVPSPVLGGSEGRWSTEGSWWCCRGWSVLARAEAVGW